jgi:alpha-ketoglutarate-dependent taurine dioxygenase
MEPRSVSRVSKILRHVCESGSSTSDISTAGCAAEEGVVVEACTGTLGAEVSGIDLSAVDEALSRTIDQLLIKHKVLFFRGQTRVDTNAQLRLIQAMNTTWGLKQESKQQKFNYQDGAFVIRMLGHKLGSPNVWPVTSGAPSVELSFDGVMAHTQKSSPPAGLHNSPASAMTTSTSSYNSQRWLPGSMINTFPGHSLLRRRSSHGGDRRIQAAAGPGTWLRPGNRLVRGAANVWHTDDQYVLEPPWATVLRAVQLPEVGGDTMFADMSAAFADLSNETQQQLSRMSVITDWEAVFPKYRLSFENEARTNGGASGAGEAAKLFHQVRQRYPRCVHPLVRTHNSTGRQALNVNPVYCRGLAHDTPSTHAQAQAQAQARYTPANMEEAEEQQLLQELFTLPQVPEYQCRFRWKNPGDMCMWDNRVLQHYAVADYGESIAAGGTRHMEHTASLGDRPFYQAEAGERKTSHFIQ